MTSSNSKPARRPGGVTLQNWLISTGRTRWIDVGSGGRFDDGFECVDVLPPELLTDDMRSRYHRFSMVDPSPDLEDLGTFDLVRAQHVLEHLSWEDGGRFIANCLRIMHSDSVLLITVPDLRRHIEWYQSGYQDQSGFRSWAEQRVPSDATPSMYFSVFAHSMLYESHKWCYDDDGLRFQLEKFNELDEVRILPVTDVLAEIPFTHNRPDEDLCAIAWVR